MKLHVHQITALQKRIKSDIDNYSVQTLSGTHRGHLGASIIGEECCRKIWYSFRWVRTQFFNGRMLRLFETGHREEQRFIANLRGIGFKIWDIDERGNQYRISGCNGHYQGSPDSIAIAPYPEFNGEPMLAEFKTHNTGSFVKLLKEGVIISKPQHYAQMCSYGRAFGFEYGLYCAINKNDDDTTYEIVQLDPRHADDLVGKASDIIYSHVPPPKISLQPEYFECKFCSASGVCHQGEPAEKNCRSCSYSQPADNAEWYCSKWQNIIPKDFIPTGCDQWREVGK